VCIKPLLDEEAADRQKAWMEEQQQAQVAAGLVAPQPMLQQPQMELMGNMLPVALLQQYPALAALDWNTIPQGPPPDEDVYGGRSSFDASSGGEYDFDVSEGEMNTSGYNDQSMSGMGNNQQVGGMQNQNQNQQGFFQGNGAGGYLSDFEGR
jgi:hypothetical protein